MKSEPSEINIKILGKSFPVKCAPSEVDALQRAAQYLDEKMRALRDSNNMISAERIAIIVALNVVSELLDYDQHKERQMQNLKQRMLDLQQRMEKTLTPQNSLELDSYPAE